MGNSTTNMSLQQRKAIETDYPNSSQNEDWANWVKQQETEDFKENFKE